jgi:hypothetical protein
MGGHPTAVELAHRLRGIDWAGNFDHTRSRVKLMQEYLRRASWWAQRLDRTPEWPFFDVAEAIDPAVRADPELVARTTQGLGWYAKRICAWALHLAELRTVVPDLVPDLDDPYEPLIIMFERGGDFTTANSRIEVDLAQFPVRSWVDYRTADPVVALDPAALDELDQAGRPG